MFEPLGTAGAVDDGGRGTVGNVGPAVPAVDGRRALYASRGGLTDSFLKNGLKLDPKEFHAEIGPAFTEQAHASEA
jgi:hypothetical protein